MVMGGNPAEAHPVSLQHILEGKELNRANMIVIDPRMTRTAAHATEYVRVRPGTHIPTIYGMLWHIFQNGWEDKEFIRQRVYGLDDIRAEVAKWTPDEVERVTGLAGSTGQARRRVVCEGTAGDVDLGDGPDPVHGRHRECPRELHPAAGHGQRRHISAVAPTFSAATPMSRAPPISASMSRRLPLYYGLAEDAWRHWCRVWEVDYDWMLSRFASKTLMETPGIPSTRWFDATLLPKDQVGQPDTLKAMFVMGHGAQHHHPDAAGGARDREARSPGRVRSLSDHVVGALGPQERHLSAAGLHQLRDERVAHRLEPLAAMGRADRPPVFESKNDYDVMYMLATQARLRRPDVQEHQGRQRRGVGRRHPA